MSPVDELKGKIKDKVDEIKKLQRAGKTTQAAILADETEKLMDELNIEQVKEKSDFNNFKRSVANGTVTRISGDGRGVLSSNGKAIGGEYCKHFLDAARSNFRNAANVLVEGADPNGGFLVPVEMNDEIVTKLTQENVMRQLATVITTSTKHSVPVTVSQPQASWIREGQQINLTDESFSQIELGAHKLVVALKVSNELLQDTSYDLEAHFVGQFTQALSNAEEDSFINGNSTSDTATPTGFLTTLNANSDASVVSTDAFADSLIRLVYSLPRPYRKNSCFLMHDSSLETIRKLKDLNSNYLWTPSVIEGEPDRLLGHPIFTSSFFPTAEKSGDTFCAFGDFSRYYIADRGARTFRALREICALEDVSAFLMIERVDGRLVDENAIKLLKLG